MRKPEVTSAIIDSLEAAVANLNAVYDFVAKEPIANLVLAAAISASRALDRLREEERKCKR